MLTPTKHRQVKIVTKKSKPVIQSVKLIYNPHAGKKRHFMLSNNRNLETMKQLLEKYQIDADYFPTKKAGHAIELARESIKEGYKLVLVAGGDGTVSEVANGLIGSDVTLGILPLGSFMNIALMLSIPFEIEKAIEIIKIGRTRKIDVGCITRLDGDKLSEPFYFLEGAGLGIEAQLQHELLQLEKGHYAAFFKILRTLFDFYGHSAHLKIDDEEIVTKATMVCVSNGPFTGANIPLAPKAKLNDHRLTVTFFKMSKLELIGHILKLKLGLQDKSSHIQTHSGRVIKISTRVERLVHADARIFGTTPVEFKVQPNALNVITGFPNTEDNSLVKRGN